MVCRLLWRREDSGRSTLDSFVTPVDEFNDVTHVCSDSGAVILPLTRPACL